MENAQEPRKPLSGRALGLVLIFLTAIIWVAASFISQLLVNTEEGKPSYNVSPFLLTYLSTSIFTIFLPLVQLKNLLQETRLLRCVLAVGRGCSGKVGSPSCQCSPVINQHTKLLAFP
jgi:hypothetical protein